MDIDFEKIVNAISEDLDANLHVDVNGACTVLFDDVLPVHLELDENDDLIIFSAICTLDPGKYREKILSEALKENDKFPSIATLGYFEEENSLALFNFLDLKYINEKTLISYLMTFVELGFLYYNSLTKGKFPSLRNG